MEGTTIILVALFAICGIVLLWALKNGNNIKIKKKEKKAKKSNEDKFKDVVPKEKKQKVHKQKISKNAKSEKAGTQEMPTNRVVKVTKEDFKSNDIEVPKSLETPEKPSAPLEKEKVQKKDDFNKVDFKNLVGGSAEDFGFKEDLEKLKLPEIKDFKEDDDDEFWKNFSDDLISPPLDDAGKMDAKKMGFDEQFPKFNDTLGDDEDFWKGLADIQKPVKNEKREDGEILNEVIEARFEKVFGKTSGSSSVAKEIIIGDVMSGNRSRANRELREKRLKRVVSPLPTDNLPKE